jgi:glutamine synthetase
MLGRNALDFANIRRNREGVEPVVYDADLLRVSIAHAGNDHRLGANEAPPAIISIYLGEQLTEVVENLVDGTSGGGTSRSGSMRLGVSTLPVLPRDATDRNRTSPFAFTGNKFEFRAVGSSQGTAKPNAILNTIVAESLAFIAERIEERGPSASASAISEIVVDVLKQHRRVIFNGNGYSEEWQHEAERRGLPNLRNAVDAIGRFGAPEKVALFERFEVLSTKETMSRMNIMYEAYSKAIAIECQSAIGLARTAILPASQKHQTQLAQSILAARNAGQNVEAQEGLLRTTSERIERLVRAIEDLGEAFERCEHHAGSAAEHAARYRDDVAPKMQTVRDCSDSLEILVDDSLWPLPKYREMLFLL